MRQVRAHPAHKSKQQILSDVGIIGPAPESTRPLCIYSTVELFLECLAQRCVKAWLARMGQGRCAKSCAQSCAGSMVQAVDFPGNGPGNVKVQQSRHGLGCMALPALHLTHCPPSLPAGVQVLQVLSNGAAAQATRQLQGGKGPTERQQAGRMTQDTWHQHLWCRCCGARDPTKIS